MNATDQQPLFAEVSAELAALAAEVRALVAARWQLLRLELFAARDQLRRLAVALLIAIVAALAALPVLIVAAGEALDGVAGLPNWAWHLILSGVLLVGAIVSAWWAWRRFQRQFQGCAESLDELREDLVWLGELQRRSR